MSAIALTNVPTTAGNEKSDPESIDSRSGQLQVVTFRVGDVRLGIKIDHVQEINRLTDVTPVPGASAHIHGVVNLRGDVVTIINAHRIFELPSPEQLSRGRNLILQFDNERLGVLVDEVTDILTIHNEELLPRPANLRAVDRRFIHSVCLRDDNLFVILDAAGLIAAIDESCREKPSA